MKITTPDTPKEYDMDNATLVLLIDSKLDELKGRSLVDANEMVDFLLDLRNAAAYKAATPEDKELITN
jgi:hypothetical protein